MSGQPPIDWEQIGQSLGTLQDDGEVGGSDVATRALEEIIGSHQWRAAVDYYVSGGRGAQLARSVLWLVHPWAAMERCHELFLTSQDPESRQTAVELLRVVADRRVLPWISEYLNDSDAGVQTWAAGIVDQLLWSSLIEPEECKCLLEKMSRHPNAAVQETLNWIHSFLQERSSRTEPPVAQDGSGG